MAGKIVADQLEHSTAGSIATNFVVEGSCKSWVNVNGSGSAGSTLMRDSFNISSDTDNGTGSYTLAFSTSMNNANYAASSGTTNATDAGTYNPAGICDRATGSYRMDIESSSSSQADPGIADATIFGDLA